MRESRKAVCGITVDYFADWHVEVCLLALLQSCIGAMAAPCIQIGPVLFLPGAAGSHVTAGTLMLLKAALLARLCWGVLEGNTW